MSRKSTPDVMDALMGSQPESNKAIKEANGLAGNMVSGKAIEQEILHGVSMASNKAVELENHTNGQSYSNKTIKPESNKASLSDEDPKEKATFNMTTESLQQLEEVWFKLKREVKGTRVTKTLIVERALRLAIDDYHQRGQESDIFKSL